MFFQLYRKSLFVLILFLSQTIIKASDGIEIKQFFSSIKTQEDLISKLSYKNLLSFELFTSSEYINSITLISEMTYAKLEQEIKNVFPNQELYKTRIEKEMRGFASGIDLDILKMSYESKKLSTGEILILFDDNKKKLKIPFVLIKEGDQLRIDSRTLVTTPNILEYNKLSKVEIIDVLSVIAIGQYFYFNKDLDYSYLIEIFDNFKQLDDVNVKKLHIYMGGYFSSILRLTGARLIDKNLKLELFERKLIAAQLHFSIYMLKGKKIDEIKAAYDIAEEIINAMSDEEKTIYLIGKK